MTDPVSEGIVAGLEFLSRAQARANEYENLLELFTDAYSTLVYIVEGREVNWDDIDGG